MQKDRDNPGVVFLMGPTASGKTGLAVELVKLLNADIISVDSAMVYRGLDIGTAKPDAETLAKAPHRLIDIRDPAEPYSAAEFCQDARREIEDTHARGRLPLLVGGTSLYFSALERGLSPLPAADPRLRSEIEQEAQQSGWAALHQQLAEIDPVAAHRIHPNDAQRIQRALEIFRLTQRAPSTIHAETDKPRMPWPLLKLAMMPVDRDRLHSRIEMRFEQMMNSGFYEEVEKLHERPDLNESLPAVRAVGYRQLWQVVAGKWSLQKGVERGIIASRQLAKRQLTWLRRESGIQWLDSDMDVRQQQTAKLITRWQKSR